MEKTKKTTKEGEKGKVLFSGIELHAEWSITEDGTLTVRGMDGTDCRISSHSRAKQWPWYRYRGLVTKVIISNVKAKKSTACMFYDFNKCAEFDLDGFDTSSTMFMQFMFFRCLALKDLQGLKNLDVSHVKYMNGMFEECKSLTDLFGASKWNTESVEETDQMFCGCESLADLNGIAEWDVRLVKSMTDMFTRCEGLKNLDALERWNTASLLFVTAMFYGCEKLTDISGIKGFNTRYVEHMDELFCKCRKLSDIYPISGWNMENVMGMSSMFRETAVEETNAFLKWKLRRVYNLNSMFLGCTRLTDLSGLVNWRFRDDADAGAMFAHCDNLKDINPVLKNWPFITDNKGNKYEMFHGCSLKGFAPAVPVPMACPGKGAFECWKAGWTKIDRRSVNLLIKLRVPADAKRCAALTNECRANKVEVVEFYTLDGNPLPHVHIAFDRLHLKYRKGEVVEHQDFDENRFNEAGPEKGGITFFMTKEEASK